MERSRFAILDSWRGVCAVIVSLHHLNADSHIYNTWFIQDAWLFVDFFFVLSGFVISYAYSDRLNNWREVGDFVLRRFGRLWPLHVAMLALLVSLEAVKLIAGSSGVAVDRAPFGNDKVSLVAIVTNLLLIQSLGIHDTLTWNFPSWSISTEFYTYLIFALVFIAGRAARIVAPALVAAASALIVAVWANDGMYTTYEYGLFRCAYGFFVGHLAWRLWRTGLLHGIGACREAVRGGVEIGAVALAVVFVSVTGASAAEGTSPWTFAAPFVFGAVVLVFAEESGIVSRLLSLRLFAIMGACSYSIYMIHEPLVQLLDRGLKFSERFGAHLLIERSVPWEKTPAELIFIGNRWIMDGFTIAYVAGVVMVAMVTYRLIEQPGRSFFNRLASRPRRMSGSGWNADPIRGPQQAE